MSDAIKDLIVRILVDDDQVEKFQKSGGKALEFGKVLDKGAVASAGALALLAGGAFEAGDAAAEAEQSAQQLQFALDKYPAAAGTSADALYKLNGALAEKTQFDDDAYASGQAILAQFGLTGDQIKQLTPLLGDYAAKTGVDIPTAADQLGKGLLGQGRALKSVGIDFKDTGSLGGNYAEILSGLTDKVGGFAQSQGDTATGSNAIFKNSIHELFEALGQDLLPVMVNVTHQGLEVMDWMRQNKDVVVILAAAIGTIASGILLLSGVMKVWAAVQAIQTALQWANNAAWLASPVTWIILAVIVAIGLLVAAAIWLYDNWDGVTKWIGEAWHNVLTWFQSVGDAIASWWNGFWNGIVSFAKGIFEFYINLYVGIFMFLWNGLVAIGQAIASWWNALWKGVGEVFSWLWSNGIKPVLDAIGAAFQWLYNTFIDPIVKLILIAVGLLVIGFQWLWTNAIQPALNAIGTGMKWLYDNAIKPVIDAVGAVFSWLYSNVFQPIGQFIQLEIQAIGLIFNWLYANVFQPVGQFIQQAIAAVGTAFRWIYDNVFAPVGKFIADAITNVGNAIQLVNEYVIQPSFKAIGSAFQWVYDNVIKPVAKFIGDAIHTIGDVVSSVFGAIGDTIRGAFNGVVGFIKGVVNGIIDGVNTVIGGINTVGKIAGKALGINLTIGKLPRLATGGIVMSPTIAEVGEAGHEAILPLNSPAARELLGGGGDEPTELSERTLDRLANKLAAVLRNENRKGFAQ